MAQSDYRQNKLWVINRLPQRMTPLRTLSRKMMRHTLLALFFALSLSCVSNAAEKVISSFAESTEAPHGRGNLYAPEILKHCERIANHYGLYDKAVLSTEVTSLEWEQSSQRWVIRTDRGDVLHRCDAAQLERPSDPSVLAPLTCP